MKDVSASVLQGLLVIASSTGIIFKLNTSIFKSELVEGTNHMLKLNLEWGELIKLSESANTIPRRHSIRLYK